MATDIQAWTAREAAEIALGDALGNLGSSTGEGAEFILKAIDQIAGSYKQELIRDWAHSWLDRILRLKLRNIR